MRNRRMPEGVAALASWRAARCGPIGALRVSIAGALLCVFLHGVPALAQDSGRPSTHERDTSDQRRPAESSDLVKENLDRVAASALQIKAGLIKDQGLLVELKRWVARSGAR